MKINNLISKIRFSFKKKKHVAEINATEMFNAGVNPLIIWNLIHCNRRKK